MSIATVGGMRKIPGTIGSTVGASQRPAMKPRTTVGNAAITSTVGLTTALSVGCMNCEAYSAERSAIGIAKTNA
jgi:hypothetical protein